MDSSSKRFSIDSERGMGLTGDPSLPLHDVVQDCPAEVDHDILIQVHGNISTMEENEMKEKSVAPENAVEHRSTPAVPNEGGALAEVPEASKSSPKKPEKSALTILCEDFLHKFGHVNSDGTPKQFFLNDVSAHCNVPRRRMYDVINVLEALGIVERTGKLQYSFKGYDALPNILSDILVSEEDGEKQPEQSSTSEGKETSALATLTRKLIRVILFNGGEVLLSQCAASLLGPGVVAETVKKKRSQHQITTERRLYDIGSILISIGLLEKRIANKRQPAFKWIYGWMPGEEHEPPVLEAAKKALEPAPELPALTEEQIMKSSRKRNNNKAEGSKKKASKLEHTPVSFPPAYPLLQPSLDDESLSKMLLHPAMFNTLQMPMLQPQFTGMMDPQDSLAGLDPAVLSALLAAQQNFDFSSQQPPMMHPEVPQDFMMQLLYPYMFQQQSVPSPLDLQQQTANEKMEKDNSGAQVEASKPEESK
jgi:hypothetical protein